jgi:hypothetical protein
MGLFFGGRRFHVVRSNLAHGLVEKLRANSTGGDQYGDKDSAAKKWGK